jgi:hypothetical protein
LGGFLGGGVLLATWAVGVVVYPGPYLLGLSTSGIIIFFSGWSALYARKD